MAHSIIKYTYNGTQTDFDLSFTGGFRVRSDITCRTESPGTVPVSFSWLTDTRVRVDTSNLVAGNVLVFTRTVSKEQAPVDLLQPNNFTREGVDAATKHSLQLIHEVLDGRTDTFAPEDYIAQVQDLRDQTSVLRNNASGFRDQALSYRNQAQQFALQAEATADGLTVHSGRAAIAAHAAEHPNDPGPWINQSGFVYGRGGVAPDGLTIIAKTYNERWEAIKQRIVNKQVVRIAAFGDSTTDGVGLSGFDPVTSRNPIDGSGNAIGNTAHAPANAWPTVMQGMLRAMTKANGVSVWNAGYGGRAIVDDWAVNNFERAIINNPAYGNPDVVILNFGLNDMLRAGYSPALWRDKLKVLINLIDYYGCLPVIVSPDPALSAGRAGLFAGLNQMSKQVCKEYDMPFLDSHKELTYLAGSSGLNMQYGFLQPDNLHLADAGHRIKASYLAAEFFANTLWIEGETQRSVFPWDAECNVVHGVDAQWSLYKDANNRPGASMNLVAGSYTAGAVILDLWAYSRTPHMEAWWRSLDGDGYYNPGLLSNAPELVIMSYTTGFIVPFKNPACGFEPQPGGSRDSETPIKMGAVQCGLNRFQWKAPSDNNSRVMYLGYFSFAKADNKEVIIATHYSPPGDASLQSVVTPGFDPFGRNPRYVGYGVNKAVRFLLDLTCPDGAGVFLYTGRCFWGTEADIRWRHRGLAIVRNGANLQLRDVVYDNSGVLADNLIAQGAYTWDNKSNELVVRITGQANGDVIFQVTPAATPAAPVFTATRVRTVAPLSRGGYIGAMYKHYGVSTNFGTIKAVFYEVNT